MNSARTTARPATWEIPTPLGSFTALYSDTGLCGLSFPRTSSRASQETAPPARRCEGEVGTWMASTRAALEDALSGRKPGRLPPLDLSAGTPFQREVWRAMLSIPPGKTMSYGEIARKIGCPGAARAVGQACGANPIPVLIPCHRVLASGGRLGGFSGGLDWKRRLLGLEGLSPG